LIIETKGYLKGFVSPEKVLYVIQKLIDPKARMHTNTVALENDKQTVTSGFIIIDHSANPDSDPNVKRIFYHYDNMNTYDDLESCAEIELEDMVKAEKTKLTMDYDEAAVNIMNKIIKEFGGWIDENSNDDNSYKPVSKDPTVPDSKNKERTYFFKAKRVDNEEWIEGDLIRSNFSTFIVTMVNTIIDVSKPESEQERIYSLEYYKVDPDTLCEYVGIRDKNNIKVFEHDIVIHNVYGKKEISFGSYYDSLKGCLGFMYSPTMAFLHERDTNDIEIIGNSFDNPDLVK